jgi:hypothetical protein
MASPSLKWYLNIDYCITHRLVMPNGLVGVQELLHEVLLLLQFKVIQRDVLTLPLPCMFTTPKQKQD